MQIFRFLRANARLVGFGFALCFLSSAGQTYFISLFGGGIRAEFDLSHGEFGTVYAAGTLASAATLIWLGRIVDRWTVPRTTFATLLGLSAVAAFAGVVWDQYVLAVAIYGLRLLGQGMSTHIGVTTMARYFVAERGRALSVASLGQAVGAALSPPFIVALLAATSWREAWWVTALLVLTALPLTLWLIRREDFSGREAALAGTHGTSSRDHTVSHLLRDVGFWLRMPVMIAPAFISTGFVFHQIHIARMKGWPLETMAASFTAYAIASVAGLLLAGPLVDRYSARALVPFYLLPLSLCCLVLATASADWCVPIYLGLMGLGTGISAVVMGAIWAELYGTANLGAIRSFSTALMVFSTGLAPAVMGWGFDEGTSVATIALASGGYCIAASALAALAKPPRPLTKGPASGTA